MKQSSFLTTLTPLRGIAALLVLLFHANNVLLPLADNTKTRFIESGFLWVDFFFILSGFIISYVYGSHFKEAVTSGGIWKYMLARFARVYPLHLFTLIWVVVCVVITMRLATSLDPFFLRIYNLKAIPASLLMVQSMHVYTTLPLNSPSWSLSTEWWAYFVFPFLAKPLASLKNSGKLTGIILLIAFYVFLMFYVGPNSGSPKLGKPTMDLTADFGFLRCIAAFILGMFVYEFYKDKTGYALLKRSWVFLVFFSGLITAMHFGINHLLIIAFFPLIIMAAAYNNTNLKRILDMKILQRLGDWSFSIYMVHIPIVYTYYIFLVKENPSLFADISKFSITTPSYIISWAVSLIFMAITIFISFLTYRFIEVPARNYFNRPQKKNKKAKLSFGAFKM